MARYWATSDWHFYHHEIIGLAKRPFENVDEMHEYLVRRHNQLVAPDDVVCYLGDMIYRNVEGAAAYINRLNGYRICAVGNHDPSKEKLRRAGFHAVLDQHYIVHKGVTFWLAHIPVHNESDRRKLERPEAFAPYDVALCGHVHGAWRTNRGSINVGLEAWSLAPVSFDDLFAMKATAESGVYRGCLPMPTRSEVEEMLK